MNLTPLKVSVVSRSEQFRGAYTLIQTPCGA